MITKDKIIKAVKDEIMQSFGSLTDHYMTLGIVTQAVNKLFAKYESMPAPKLSEKEWMTTAMVSEEYLVSIRTLAEWRKNKIIPFSRIGTKILYRRADIEKYIAQTTVQK